MIETWFKNWWAQLIMMNLNFTSLSTFVSALGAYYGSVCYEIEIQKKGQFKVKGDRQGLFVMQ